jgi:hypothetical protein
MLDNDRMTGWTTSVPQAGGEEVVVDLGASAMVEGVALGLGGYVGDYPRLLAIELSDDAQNWNERWRGATATRAVSAALRDPLNLTVYFPFASSRARYIRLRQLGSSRQSWSIAQLTVIGATSGH